MTVDSAPSVQRLLLYKDRNSGEATLQSTAVQNVVIVGAGGHGSEVRAYLGDLVRTREAVHLLGFIDDNRPPGPWLETEILGRLPQLCALASSLVDSPFGYITALGENQARYRIVRAIEAMGLSNLRPWTLRHPSA